ncbi:hypothetical protein MVES1_000987 [Malassezia vespertilionis]|uniref:uncharacterized protein n=1 Tax=Malassezia vespertilionis TaxID=2020962 RepID=UPI0024B08D02|nr:uncharacterized protein MVES1_000987 [Malassezia vespertilionis]WFD05655.1 hypothetical protein MVES1_000987 [Malassezia vespertilionis]
MSSLLTPFSLGSKHAHFHVTVTIHELANVPVLSGEFAVAWKIQHTAGKRGSPHGTFQEHVDPGRSKLHLLNTHSGNDVPHTDTNRSQGSQHTPETSGNEPRSPQGKDEPEQARARTNALVDHALHGEPSVESLQDSGSEPQWNRLRQLREGKELRRTRTRSGSNATRSMPHIVAHAERKGQTEFERVYQNTVKFERKIETVVRIAVGKSDVEPDREESDSSRGPRSPQLQHDPVQLGMLHESLMRVRVIQALPKEVHGLEHHHHNHDTVNSMGYVHLDLAQYAPRMWSSNAQNSHRRLEMRQYLLCDSTTNALLRVSVDMRYLYGPQMYRVPHISGGILDLAGLTFQNNDKEKAASNDATKPRDQNGSTREDGLNVTHSSFEWHYKLPLSDLFCMTAVAPEHLQDASKASIPTMPHHGSKDGNNVPYCDMNTQRMVDNLFQGIHAPSSDNADQETRSISSDMSSDTQAFRSMMARLRWDKLIHSVSQATHGAAHPHVVNPLRQLTHSSNSSQRNGGGSSSHPSSGTRSPIASTKQAHART